MGAIAAGVVTVMDWRVINVPGTTIDVPGIGDRWRSLEVPGALAAAAHPHSSQMQKANATKAGRRCVILMMSKPLR
jgi:hypothetical protein